MYHAHTISWKTMWRMCFLTVVSLACLLDEVLATPVPLQNGTATFSQSGLGGGCGYCGPNEAIDGLVNDVPGELNGWSIAGPPALQNAESQTAVWETTNDVSTDRLVFTMLFDGGLNPLTGHMLGRFRLSVTDDPRDTFADGFDVGGDVTAD